MTVADMVGDVICLALTLDEIDRIAQQYKRGQWTEVRRRVDDDELRICMGSDPHASRELTAIMDKALRFVEGLRRTRTYPMPCAVVAANALYMFYEDDAARERADDENPVQLARIGYVLRTVRRIGDALDTEYAKRRFDSISAIDAAATACLSPVPPLKKRRFGDLVRDAKCDVQRALRRGFFA